MQTTIGNNDLSKKCDTREKQGWNERQVMRAIRQTEHSTQSHCTQSNHYSCVNNYLCVGSVRRRLLLRIPLLLLVMECLQLDRFSTTMPCTYKYQCGCSVDTRNSVNEKKEKNQCCICQHKTSFFALCY